MNEKLRASWERTLHPETLKSNIITASIFSMAFEMLKSSIHKKIQDFFMDGFDESGMIISPKYKKEVLSLHKNSLYASLKWLQIMEAINEEDLKIFEYIKRCRNTLTHEILKFASEGVDFDVAEAFEQMVSLLKKIEIWWFENLEMAIDPDAYPNDLDLEKVVPGSVWSLQMLLDVALGPEEEARKYYDYFVAKKNQLNKVYQQE